MKMKRIAALIMSTILVGSLVGCGKAEEGNSGKVAQEGTQNGGSDSEVTSLEVYGWDDDITMLKPIAEKYEKETGIKININEYPNADYHDKMMVLLNAGEDVDVIDLGFIGNITPYVTKGMIEPLTDYIKTSGVDMSVYGEGYSAYQFDGVYYSLPMRRVVWMMYANTDILDEMGVTIPDNMTYDQYVDIAKKLTVGEGDSKQFGGQWMPWTKHMQLVQAGKTIVDDDLTELQSSYEFLNQVMNTDNSFMNVAQMAAGANDYISWFLKGQTATMIQGEWCVQQIKKRLQEENITDFHYDCYPMPIYDGVDPLTTGGNYSTWGIASTSKKKQAAYEFLQYITGADAAKDIATTGKIPGYCDEEIQKLFVENSGVPSADKMFTFKTYDLMPTYAKAGEINQMMNEESELYLVGSQTIEETMDHIYERRKEIMSEK